MTTRLVQLAVVAPPERLVTAGRVHPNGNLVLVCCGFDARNLVWSREKEAFLPLSPDGTRIAMARRHGSGHDLVVVLDTHTHRLVHALWYSEGTSGLMALHWHPSGDTLVTTHEHDDGAAMNFWQVAGEEPSCLKRRPSAYWSFAFSGDGKWLFEDVYRGGLCRVDAETWEETVLTKANDYKRLLSLSRQRSDRLRVAP